MKNIFCKKLSKLVHPFVFFLSLVTLNGEFLNAEYSLEELEIDSSTKTEEDGSALPTNPFEIVEMIRRYNSLNNATNPSDALDDALESFHSSEKKKEI